jgi:hypothetical protein
MLNTIVILVLVAAALWVLWEIYKNGWDVKKGIGAVVAVLAAWWVWMHDTVTNALNGM